MDETLHRLLAKHFSAYPRELMEKTRFKRDLKADSLDLLELLYDIERECRLFIPEEELANAVTIGDMDRIFTEIKAKESRKTEEDEDEERDTE